MSTATRQSMRQKKQVEHFIDIQESLTKNHYHGRNDTWDRTFNGKEGTNTVFTPSDFSGNSSGYLKDGFIVEDGSLSDEEYVSSSDFDEDTDEDYGIGCNKCYSCVTGGAGPCVLDEEEEAKLANK